MRNFIIGVVLFVSCILLLVAYATFRLTEPKPKVIKVIASGQKYYPNPVPMKKKITPEVIEKSEYEVLY